MLPGGPIGSVLHPGIAFPLVRKLLALNAGAVAAIVALLVVPTYIVSTVKPDESIRYE